MQSKKGILSEQTVLLVILVAAALVLFSGAIAFVNFFKSSSDLEACRLSVLAHEQLKFVGKSPISLDCPRREVEFFSNKVEIDGKKSKEYSFNEINEDVVNRVAADELASCWYKIGEGKVDVFDQEFIADKNHICLVCAEISFKDKVKDSTFSNLDNFLKKNTMQSSGITYHNYLTEGQRDKYINLGVVDINLPWTQYLGGWRDASTNLVKEDQSFNTKERYVIYFLAFKPDWINVKLAAFTPAYYVGLGKTSKLSRECNLLVN